MTEAQEPKAKKKPTQAPPPPILAAASLAWIRDRHHPRLSRDEACAFMAMVFPKSRHQCRALECPRQCPRHPDFGEPAPPPAWSAPPPPPLTPAEFAAQELGLAPLRVRRREVAVEEECRHDIVPVNYHWGQCSKCGDDSFPLSVEAASMAADDKPEPLTAAQEALWAEQVDAWVGTPASLSSPAGAAFPSLSSGASASPASSCCVCGRRRTIMLAMAAGVGKPAGVICSFCYRGERAA